MTRPFAAFLTFLIAISMSYIAIRWIAPLGWQDQPGHRKIHTKTTPLTGGIAFHLTLILGLLLGVIPHVLPPPYVALAMVMGIIGLFDDRLNLKARWKAILGLAVAITFAILVAKDLRQSFHVIELIGFRVTDSAFLVVVLLALWFWFLPQGYNLIDGMNGLSIGYGLIVSLALGYYGNLPIMSYAALFLGCLVFNYPKARHFMGDCGSLFLGAFLSVLAVKVFLPWNPELIFWVFMYPILDTFLVISVRCVLRKPVFNGDQNHLHHWFLSRSGGRAWLATPALLLFVSLPMLRVVNHPAAMLAAKIGALGLVGLTLWIVGGHLVLRRRPQSNHENESAVAPWEPEPESGM